MKKAKANKTYAVLILDENGLVIEPDDLSSCMDVDQFKDEILEVWKEREDGFLFVYCERLEIGYWVSPNLITIIQGYL